MKTHHTGFHSGRDQSLGLADQDAAIDVYLDGLLRDPDSEPHWSADSSMDSVDDYDEVFSDEELGNPQLVKRPIGLSLVDLSKFKAGVIGALSAESVLSSPQSDENVLDVSADVNLHAAAMVEPVVEQEAPVVMAPEEQFSDALSLDMVTEELVDLAEEYEVPVPVAQPEQPVEFPLQSHKRSNPTGKCLPLGISRWRCREPKFSALSKTQLCARFRVRQPAWQAPCSIRIDHE